ncbi:MAG: phosphate transport system permease protein [Bacillota bacterium]|nr:phosphate transport system permease protein [Bacillota bacterium]
MRRAVFERGSEVALFLAALIAVVIIVLIGTFILIEGLPAFERTGLLNFLLGHEWRPLQGVFGIFPMIVGSIAVTAVALAVGVPLGLATAIFLAEIAPPRAERLVRPAVELLAGIPSVVYGLFGMTMLVPIIRALAQTWLGASLDPQFRAGYSVLAAGLVLGIMILPTIINIAEDVLRAQPLEYKEGSLALGATHWQTIACVLLPAARPGIVAAIVLAMGRAIGETMAVIMVAGNTPVLPQSLFSPVRTLTSNIALEMPYAGPGAHSQALYATGVVLFGLTMVVNLAALLVSRRRVKRG